MRIIGSKYTRVGQGLNLLLFFLWLLVSVFFLFINKSSNGIYVLIIGAGIWGLASFLYLQIFEVAIAGKRIILRNLFSKEKIEKSDFKKIEKTALSPFIFKITFKSSKSYFFIIENDTFFKALFSFDPDYTTKILNKAFNNN